MVKSDPTKGASNEPISPLTTTGNSGGSTASGCGIAPVTGGPATFSGNGSSLHHAEAGGDFRVSGGRAFKAADIAAICGERHSRVGQDLAPSVVVWPIVPARSVLRLKSAPRREQPQDEA